MVNYNCKFWVFFFGMVMYFFLQFVKVKGWVDFIEIKVGFDLVLLVESDDLEVRFFLGVIGQLYWVVVGYLVLY